MVLKNKLQDVAITMGMELMPAIQRMFPAIETVLGAVASAVVGFSKLPIPVQTAAFAIAGFAAAIGPVLFSVGTLMQGVAGMAGAFKMAIPAILGIGSALATAALPLTAFVAAMVGLNKLSQSKGFLHYLSTSSDMPAILLRNAFGKEQLTEAQFEQAFNKMNGGAAPAMVSVAQADRLSPAEQLEKQMAHLKNQMSEANQRALNPQLLANAVPDLTKMSEAEQAAIQRSSQVLARHNELSGAAAMAAAQFEVDALQGVNLNHLDAESRERVNETLINGIEAYQRQNRVAPQAMRDLASATMPVLEEIGASAQNLASLTNDMTDAMREASMVKMSDLPFEMLPTAAENMGNLASLAGTVNDEMRQMSAVQAPKWWTEFLDVTGISQVLDAVSRIPGLVGAVGAALGGALGGGLQSATGLMQMFKSGQRMTGIANSIAGMTSSALAVWDATNVASTAGKIGGGAASGAMTGAAIGSVVPGLGTAVGSGIGAGFGALVGFVRSRIVGQDEKDARKSFAEFQQQILSMATAQQVAAAGGDKWATMNLVIADSYNAIGKSTEEALGDINRVLDATHLRRR